MLEKLQADITQLKVNLSNTEKLFRLQTMSRRPVSPVPEIRPPWNYGGSSCKSHLHSSVVPSKPGMGPTDQSKRRGAAARSRSSSRLAIQSPKNIVHKETIDAGDKKTVVEVTVQTKHQRRSSSVPRHLTDGYSASKPSNVELSKKSPKKSALNCEGSKGPSWSNILSSQKLSHQIPIAASVNRSCETTTPCLEHRSRSRNCIPQYFHGEKPNEGCLDINKNFGNTVTSISPQKKLKFLFKELKGISVNNPTVQKLILGIEEAMENLSAENLEPPLPSLAAKTPSAQQTLHSLSNGVLYESPKLLSPSHVGCQGQESVTEPSLMRLSPDPLSSKQQSLKRKCTEYKGEAAPLIENFLELLNSLPSSPPPEVKHRSRKLHSKNEQVPIFKEQLEKACVVLEETCKRMEEESEKLKSENVVLRNTLRGKEEELQTVLSARQKMEKEVAQIRADRDNTNLEIERLHEQASKSRNGDHEKIIKDLQKRIEELSERNLTLGYEMNVSRMERDKLSMMLTTKTMEADKFRKEINILRGVQIIDVEEDEENKVKGKNQIKKRKTQRIKTDLSFSDVPLISASMPRRYDLREQQKGGRNQKKDKVETTEGNQPKSTVETTEGYQPKSSAETTEGYQPKSSAETTEGNEPKSSAETTEGNQPKSSAETSEGNQPKSSAETTIEGPNTLNRSCKDLVIVSETQFPLYFSPVGAKWQRNACKVLNLKVEKERPPCPKSVPLGSPKKCITTFPDGNCFFRCISLYLTGSEDQHKCVRNAMVRFMTANSSEFEESRDSAYIKKIQTPKVWATEVEVRATARMLNVPIFTYMKYNKSDWKWQRFGPGVDLAGEDSGSRGLYLKNTGSCHYDVVESVYSLDYQNTP